MDIEALHHFFAATLEPDQDIRRQAEIHLKQAEKSIGFLGACLGIISNHDVSPGIRIAAAVFFKNRVVRRWNTAYLDKDTQDVIDEDEKPIIRERVIKALVVTNHQLRKQLVSALSVIIATDYPKEWKNLLDIVVELLNSQDLNSAYTGLLCFSEICRSYRWSANEDRPEFENLVNQYFPSLLSVADTLLKEDSVDAGEMTKLILKIYKFATYHDLPSSLQTPQSVQDWANFHVNVMNKSLPKYVLDTEESERKLDPWVKCKKWAYANLYRLFLRYGSSSLSKKFSYEQFLKLFSENVVPELLNLYFQQIEQWCNKHLWLSDESLYHLLSFLEIGVNQNKSWQLIKPHFQILVTHFLYPLLCPSDESLETFENDPQDYIHSHLDIYDETHSPDIAATALLITLTSKRKKSTLEPILQFVYSLLNQHKDPNNRNIEEAKRLEGALRLIDSISDPLVKEKSPYYSQMEGFLAALVFPHFDNKFAFVKARTCEVASRFSDIKFQDDNNLGTLYRGILNSLDDSNLPVQLEAALALQNFIKFPQLQEALSTVILPTMQKLLTLSNTIDSDAISGVMQELVEVFSEQLQPFGVELMGNLSEQFLRLARELNDASNIDPDAIDGIYDDQSDKQMAALGLLSTMVTVLLSFENSAEVVYKLEETFAPVVEFVLVHNLEDFFREVGELIENSTFLVRSISPVAWSLFERLITNLTGGIAILYLEDLMPAINNYLVYGQEQIKNNTHYTQLLFGLFKCIMTSDDSTSSELAYGGEIAQKLIFILGPVSGPYIEHTVRLIVNSLIKVDTMTTSYTINMIDTIVSCLVSQPQNTLAILIESNFIVEFFTLWFQNIPKFTRVYDWKLSALGIICLTNLSIEELDQSQLASIIPQFASNLAIILSHLPQAITNLEKRRSEYNSVDVVDSFEFDEDNDDEWENEDFDEDADATANDDYLQFLTEEAQKLKSTGFYADEDEEVVEDPLAHSVLDEINVFATFKEMLLTTQSTNPQKYHTLFGKTTAEEQALFKDIIDI